MLSVLEKPLINHDCTLPVSGASQILKDIHHNDDDEYVLEPATERIEMRRCETHGNVQSDAPLIILLSHQESTLRQELLTHATGQDIVLLLFLFEGLLWQWLNENPSADIACLILQTTACSRELISHCHSNINIRSILIRCLDNELTGLQRYTRTLPKVDGIYIDDRRLLTKLSMDLIFLSEEMGDQQREENNNEIKAQRHYDRALKFCALVKAV